MGEELKHCCRIPFRMLILKCFRPLAISKCSFGQFYWQHLHLQDIINWITCKRLKRALIVKSGDESWKVCNFLDEKLGCLGIGLTANKASISWAVKSRQWTVLPREIITRNFFAAGNYHKKFLLRQFTTEAAQCSSCFLLSHKQQ